MAHLHRSPPRSLPGRSRRVHGVTVWIEARTEYLAGVSAARVCARHGLNLSTFYDRAKREGWRRLDVLEEKVWTAGDERRLDDSPGTMAARAWRNAARAIERGARAEARSWLLVVRDMQRHVFDDAAVVVDEPFDAPERRSVSTRCDPPKDSESYGEGPRRDSGAETATCPHLSEHTDGFDLLSVGAPEPPPTPAACPFPERVPPSNAALEPAPRTWVSPPPPNAVDDPSAYEPSPGGGWRYTEAFIAGLKRKPHRHRTDRENTIVRSAYGGEYGVLR